MQATMNRAAVAAALLATMLAPTLSHAADGKAVYEAGCSACHASGLANAPKLGDKAAWEPRTKAGLEALVTSALKGKGVMPPKGGNPNLPDADARAAVEYMLSALK